MSRWDGTSPTFDDTGTTFDAGAGAAGPGARSWMQLSGVWIDGAAESTSPVEPEGGGRTRLGDERPRLLLQAMQEDEELIMICHAFMEIIKCH